MDIVRNVFSELLANLVFWLGLGLAVWVFFMMPVRKKFEVFFGLHNERALTIYLSNLWAAIDETTPWGEIIAKRELDGAGAVKDIFASASPGFPELVRGLVDNIWTRNKYNVTVEVSPREYQYSLRNMIVIGATTKNSIRRHFLMNNELLVTIEGESLTPPSSIHAKPLRPVFVIKTLHGNATHELKDGTRPAIIERTQINHPETTTARVVFMCVGMTGIESRLATKYLAQNWRELEAKTKGKRNFARCLAYDETGNLDHYFDVSE